MNKQRKRNRPAEPIKPAAGNRTAQQQETAAKQNRTGKQPKPSMQMKPSAGCRPAQQQETAAEQNRPEKQPKPAEQLRLVRENKRNPAAVFLLLVVCAAAVCAATACSSAGADDLTELEVSLSSEAQEQETSADDTEQEDASDTDDAEESISADDSAGDSSSGTDAAQEETDAQSTSSAGIYVYVCGAVNEPGVYVLSMDARVYEAIAAAGGAQEDADLERLNQAQTLTDGERLYVPSLEDTADLEAGELYEADSGTSASSSSQSSSSADSSDDKVNINTADLEELMTLSGIGETKAQSIIDYREEHGSFASIEELMEVDGIKEGTFSKIEDDITI